MDLLSGKVALVTGGTRNVGKGVAQGLCEAGATVYITGRTITERKAAAIGAAGGRAIAVPCDHSNDEEVQAVFAQIEQTEGRLDVLVNNAWSGYQRLRNRKAFPGFKWRDPFWQQPLALWDDMFQVGVRSSYVAAVFAAQRMIAQGSGLIVNISFYAGQK